MKNEERKAIQDAKDFITTIRTIIRNNIKNKVRPVRENLDMISDLTNQAIDKLCGLMDEVDMRFHNFYSCPDCKIEWEDYWDSTCDDECPECGKPISPYKSEDSE